MQQPNKPNWMRRGAMLLVLAILAGIAWFSLPRAGGGNGDASQVGADVFASRVTPPTGNPADWLVVAFIVAALVGLAVAFAWFDRRARKRASSGKNRP